MPRDTSAPVLTPGVSADDVTAETTIASEGEQQGGTSAGDLIAALQAQLAEANAKLAAQAAEAAKTPAVVFTPVTPHGAQALNASQFAHLTVAQLVKKIDAGEVKEPFVSVLCADGYYARR